MKLIVVGSNPQEATLLLNSQYVSGYHAEIILLDNGEIYLVDKSKNGTFVNGVRIAPGKEVLIHRGQEIVFADTPLDWNRVETIYIPAGVKQTISIGSHYANRIKLAGAAVSRFHATLRQMSDGKWKLCDHSKNGTTVNGARIPRDQYIPIKKKDTILCAGVPVPNPYGGVKRGVGLAAILSVCAALAIVAAIILFVTKFSGPRKMSDTKLCQQYESSVGLMVVGYHFEVTSGLLDVSDLPDPESFNPHTGGYTKGMFSKFIIQDDDLIPYDGHNFTIITGTGFFVGENGYIVTNRHVARPWEFKYMDSVPITQKQAAEEMYRQKLQLLYNRGYDYALSLISQVSVHGVLDYIKIIPNGYNLDEDSAINCMEVEIGSDVDLAVCKLRRPELPSFVNPIPLDRIATKEVASGDHVWTIGYPYGPWLQMKTKYEEVAALNHSGNVSRNTNSIYFSFDAEVTGGASGSPVFDEYGNVVGIMSSLFNALDIKVVNAVRSKHLIKLLQNLD